MERLRVDFSKMMEILEALGSDEWTGLMVPHVYMGPLPAFFYPAFQLMDDGVHGWDIRQGTGRAHGLSGDAADLLVPFMFVLWQYTADVTSVREPFRLGLRVSGRNAGDHRVSIGPDGVAFEPGPVDDLPAVIEFDPGSFVLTASATATCWRSSTSRGLTSARTRRCWGPAPHRDLGVARALGAPEGQAGRGRGPLPAGERDLSTSGTPTASAWS